MFCTNCGRQVPDGAAFCTNCGTPVKAPGPNPAAETVVAAAPATEVTPGPATTAMPEPATSVMPEPVAPTAGEAFVPPATAPVPPAATPAATTAMPPTAAPVPSQPYSPAGQPPAPKRGGKAKLVAIALLVILLAGGAGVAFVMLDPLGIMGTASRPAASEPATTGEAATTTDAAATTEAATDEAPATTKAATTAATSAATTSASTSAGDYVIPDSATHAYTKQEIRDLGLTVDELWYARNEIYARHGRGFKDSTLQSYFDSKPWYTREYSPEEFDSMADPLNSTERANADAIKAVERDMGSSHL